MQLVRVITDLQPARDYTLIAGNPDAAGDSASSKPDGGWELQAARRVLEHAREELTKLQASAVYPASIEVALRRYGKALHLAQRVENTLSVHRDS